MRPLRIPRRWMQFSLSFLLVLVAVVGAFFAGLTVERRRAEKALRIDAEVRQWLAENPYVGVVVHWPQRHLPTVDHDAWIAEGRKIPNVELALRTLLKNRDSTVELPIVAAALGSLGNGDSVPTLLYVLECTRQEDFGLRVSIINALGRLKDVLAIETLGRFAELSSDENVRANAVSALGEISGDEAEKIIQPTVDDPSEFVREVAQEVLNEMKAKQASTAAATPEN